MVTKNVVKKGNKKVQQATPPVANPFALASVAQINVALTGMGLFAQCYRNKPAAYFCIAMAVQQANGKNTLQSATPYPANVLGFYGATGIARGFNMAFSATPANGYATLKGFVRQQGWLASVFSQCIGIKVAAPNTACPTTPGFLTIPQLQAVLVVLARQKNPNHAAAKFTAANPVPSWALNNPPIPTTA